MQLGDFDYELPKRLIARFPCKDRDKSSLMLLNTADKSIEHRKFFDIVDCFDENDVLVLNNTRVIPARLIGKKPTGANIEVFLLERRENDLWDALIKPSKRVRTGSEIIFSPEITAMVVSGGKEGKWQVRLSYEGDFDEILARTGEIPLPPYIERENTPDDAERYQTVYAKTPGSVAAPTAGLHFTDELLLKLTEKGVQICYITLNVGIGTFQPVREENIINHKIHKEYYQIPPDTVETIKNAKKQGKNITAVGTTTVRTLETWSQEGKTCGYSRLFIYPGYKFKLIDRIITNFHLPKSTLLMLVSAFAGRDFILRAYMEAIERNYRFYSYGDCMFLY